MTSQNNAEILALAFSGQENFVPAAEEAAQQSPHRFLSLAPTTSASYPTTPLAKTPAPAASSSSSSSSSQLKAATAEEQLSLAKTRRSSSSGSDASTKRRYLKLGPVHFGEGDGKGDWSEDVLAE